MILDIPAEGGLEVIARTLASGGEQAGYVVLNLVMSYNHIKDIPQGHYSPKVKPLPPTENVGYWLPVARNWTWEHALSLAGWGDFDASVFRRLIRELPRARKDSGS